MASDATVYLCAECGDVLTTERADGTRLCAWCWTERQLVLYDEADEADDRYQQERDEAGR